MHGDLNVYKVSGLRGKCGSLDDSEAYRYWTAQTVDIKNSIAYNYLLSLINLRLAEIETLADDFMTAVKMDDIDLYIIVLEALTLYNDNPDLYKLDHSKRVISAMIADDLIISTSIDDADRSENLNNLIDTFLTRLSVFDPVNTYKNNIVFDKWFDEKIAENNIVKATEKEISHYVDIFDSNKISGDAASLNPNDYKTLADYILQASAYFLYLWIPDEEISKYKAVIRRRRAKEIETYRYVKKNVGNIYDDETLKNQIHTGLLKHYKMYPEEKIEYLNTYGDGKIGIGIEAILTIVTIIISTIISLIQILLQVFQYQYSVPDGYEDGAPNMEDWSLTDAVSSTNKSSFSKIMVFTLAGGLIYGLIKKSSKDERRSNKQTKKASI